MGTAIETQVENWDRVYAALREGVGMELRPEYGVLILRDADRVDFLQRMTTNNIAALHPGQSTVTVLTSATARILFVFTVVCREDDLLLLPAAGEAASLAKHLRGNIFFMDKVAVDDVSEHYRRLRTMGPQADVCLPPDGANLTGAGDGAWAQLNGVIFVKQLTYDVPGYEILVPNDHFESFMARLADAGVSVRQDASAYNARRIELGRPAPAHEATSDYSPLEAGLAWTCAEDKGCYTGQEIIARQITYDKVTKKLVGLRSDEAFDTGAIVTTDSGKKIGAVTSVAPRLGLALAIVNRAYADAGTQVVAGKAAAEVITMPFENIG